MKPAAKTQLMLMLGCLSFRGRSSMALPVDALFVLVMQDLDDEAAIRTAPHTVFLRHATRAQQWVALRYRLLRETLPFPLFVNTPLYHLQTRYPRLVVVTHMTRSDGTPLWPVPFTSLRYRDTAWFSTLGPPLYIYRVGWSYLGVYPVPSADDTAVLSGLMLPTDLTAMDSRLQIADAWVPHVVAVTAGLMMLGRERRYAEGVARIMKGLGLQTAGPSRETQEVAGVAG